MMNTQDNNPVEKPSENEGFFMTDAAKQQILISLEKRGKGFGIRVSVKTTGCSGMAYVLEYVDELATHDHCFPVSEQWSVYIDPKVYQYVRGTTMDYVHHGLNKGFEFVNPNEKGRCGCGESFKI